MDEEQKKQDYLKQMQKTAQSCNSKLPNVCPNCGYCPTCGRPYQHWNYPTYPYYPAPIITCSTQSRQGEV